jgi:ABC-type spermidine/putrescine transport system permease subunit II
MVKLLRVGRTLSFTNQTNSTKAFTTNSQKQHFNHNLTMKKKSLRTCIIALALTLLASFLAVGCATVPDENGVTIQKNRSLNPLDYIPFF